MKILLVADIHSNWSALSAIDESFDECVFLGDVVDYAADPVPCMEWVRDHARHVVRGNHDHSVAQRVSVTPGGTFRRIAAAMRPLHYDVLDDDHLTWLAQMPVTQQVEIGGMSLLLVHATPRDPMDEYIASGRLTAADTHGNDLQRQWEARLDHVKADFVCVGHTHIPMILELEHCTVLNPGSVGQPRDGDHRASYMVIEDGEVRSCRVEYDIEQTIRTMERAGIEDSVIRQAAMILKNGGNPVHRGTDSL